MLLRPFVWTALLLAEQSASQAHPALWIDVPYATQTKDGCGSAAIAMLMQYWSQKEHIPASASDDPQTIQAAIFSPQTHGIYASRMREYLQRSGFDAYPFHGAWSDLEHHLAAGRPLIVALRQAGSLHYVVLTGIDTAQGYVLMNDPARQKMLRSSRAAFENEWSGTGDWTLLAVPRSAR